MKQKGTKENPFTLVEFNELYERGEWIGGWVNEKDDIQYVNVVGEENDPIGCGCGCGCDSGAAEGEDGNNGEAPEEIEAGEHTFEIEHERAKFSVKISWTEGSITRDCTSKISASIESITAYTTIEDIFIDAFWQGHFGITYSGSYKWLGRDQNNELKYFPKTFGGSINALDFADLVENNNIYGNL